MEPMTRTLALPILAALMLPVAAAAQQQEQPGDLGRGHELARERCAGCHEIGRGEGQARDNAPSFPAIAAGNDTGNLQLLANIEKMKHPPMPGPKIDRQQMRDIVTFIRREATGDKK